MNINRILAIMKKGFMSGPRNSTFILVITAPLLYALMFVMFNTFSGPEPTIAVFEKNDQGIIKALKKNKSIKIITANEISQVEDSVRNEKADVGISFPDDISQKLKGKDKTRLKLLIGGESHAGDRAIASAAIINALRQIGPEGASVDFKQVSIGTKRALTPLELFLPLMVIVVILLNAFFLPAAFVIEEKEKKTLSAMLASPATAVEILVAFGLMGILLAIVMGMIMLLASFSTSLPPLMFVPLLLGALLMAEWGLVAGIMFKDINTFFANIKMMGILFYAPGIILMFPDWQYSWLAKFFPTYYIANPVFRISTFNEGWAQVGGEIIILAIMVIIFFFPLVMFTKKLEESAA